MSSVKANINKIHVQITSSSKNPQIELISSKIPPSLQQPRDFAIALDILKISLLNRREIIIGSISSEIMKIAIIPHDDFTKDKLALTVLNASLTVGPTIGIKLLIANFAVFIDKLSIDWDNSPLPDRINIKTDIIKMVTPEKELFNVFDIPLKSN